MHCFEFTDGCGITFGIIADTEQAAKRYAAIDCEENVDEYKIHLITDEEAKRREILDEESGLRQTIYAVLTGYVTGGNTGPSMLWHSEI